MNDFAEWLAERLRRREWNQSDFARRTGFTTGTVSRWLRNERTPDPASCDIIADVLHMDVAEVLRHAGHLPDVPVDSEQVREFTALLRRIAWTEDREAFVRSVLTSLAARDLTP